MKFDFDKPTERRGTNSVKWDVKSGELPMWIADMDFETAPSVRNAIMKVAELGIYGYSTIPDEYFASISDFWHERFGYRFNPGDMVYSNGIVAATSASKFLPQAEQCSCATIPASVHVGAFASTLVKLW